MGLFSKMKELKESAAAGMAGLQSAGSLGEVPVPGEKKLELPAGKVRVTYSQEKLEDGRSYDEWFWKKPSIDLRVQGPDGDQVAVERAAGAMVNQLPGGQRRSDFGTIELPKAGQYSIWTDPLDDWYRESGADPSLLFDAAG